MHFKLLQFVTFEFLKLAILKIIFFMDMTLGLWAFLDVWKNCCPFTFRIGLPKGLALLQLED